MSDPWRLDDGFTTVLHLKNTIDQPVYALVQVRYPGGSYNLERLPLQPFQTVAVDLRALRDAQQKDIRDSLLPPAVEGGQLVWFEEAVGSLIGRAEVMNPHLAAASSFSCPEPCQCPPSFSTAYLTPSSSVGPTGGTAQFQAMERRQDCHGVLYGPYDRTSTSTWRSDNTTVFTVSVGTVSCLQPGSGNLTAQFSATIYTLNCFQQTTNPTVGGPVVVKPRITITNNAFDPPNVTADGVETHNTSTASADIAADPTCALMECLKPGDFVVVQIIKNTAGGSFSYKFGDTASTDQTALVTLALGDAVRVSWRVTANTGTPGSKNYSFTIRVSDVRRPNDPSSPPNLSTSSSLLTPTAQVILEPTNGGNASLLHVN